MLMCLNTILMYDVFFRNICLRVRPLANRGSYFVRVDQSGMDYVDRISWMRRGQRHARHRCPRRIGNKVRAPE
jgi:hypothetical protein